MPEIENATPTAAPATAPAAPAAPAPAAPAALASAIARYDIRRGGTVKRPPNGPTVAWTPIEPVADEWHAIKKLEDDGYRCLGVIGNEGHLRRSGGHTPWCSEGWGDKRCVRGKVYAIDLTAPDMAGLETWLIGRLRAGRYPWVMYLNINHRHYSRNDSFRTSRYSDDGHLHLSGRPGYETADSTIVRDWAEHRATRRRSLTDEAVSAQYKPYGTRWRAGRLTYGFLNYDARGLTKQQIETAIRNALTTWESVTPFTFVKSDRPDIRIGFFAGNHGDPHREDIFDGPNHVLAHCFFPPRPGSASPLAGDCHFDAAETWTVDGVDRPGTYDLETVALHELGHGLGLDHSEVEKSVMYAHYHGVCRKLTADDTDGIRWVYRDAA